MIVALLSFYRERPDWLHECARSLTFCDRMVALDGAYALYEGGTPASTPEEHEALAQGCQEAGIALTLHTPDTVWAGNEVEKRTRLFQLGDEMSQHGDWHLVIDADERATVVPDDLHQRLERTDLDAAFTNYWEPQTDGRIVEFPRRSMFRAQLGLRPVSNHFTYEARDGRRLWGRASEGVEPALDLRALQFTHLTHLRDTGRADAQDAYYDTRDQLNVEPRGKRPPQNPRKAMALLGLDPATTEIGYEDELSALGR